MSTPWKTDDWHVSSWNYLSEVTSGFNPPPRVKIHDIKRVLTRDEFKEILEGVSI